MRPFASGPPPSDAAARRESGGVFGFPIAPLTRKYCPFFEKITLTLTLADRCAGYRNCVLKLCVFGSAAPHR